MKSRIAVFGLIAALACPIIATAAETQAQLKKEAKISMKKARGIALKKAPGKISSAELERENGKLIYSFDIKQSGQTGVTEVAVDAITGGLPRRNRDCRGATAAPVARPLLAPTRCV